MVVLVTGCRSGFGKLIAVEAARAGHTVYAGLRDLSTSQGLENAARGLDVIPVQLDVTNASERDAVVARILDEKGRIDALVNNAGIALGGFLEQVEEDELRQVMEVNVFGVFSMTRAVLPAMRAQRFGRIVNISSMSGVMALPGLGAYAASKFALEGMSESWRHELRGFGIHVVLLEPGPYKTDIFGRNQRIARNTDPEEGPYARQAAALRASVEDIGAHGSGDPAEIADRVLRVLDEPSPALRHPMGRSARVRVWARRLLPFGLIEALVSREMDRRMDRITEGQGAGGQG